MKSLRIFLALAVMALATGSASWASSGTEGASFLDIPVGAGPASMGSAYSALATNAYAPVWNPSGLAQIEGNEMATQYTSYLESMNYEFLSFVHPLSKSRDSDVRRGVGASVQYLGSGDINGTDDTGASTGDFSSHYAAFNLSYGQTFTDKLSMGLTGKMINGKIDDVSASAYAADLGGMYKVNDKLNLAATVVNMGTKLKFLSEGDSLPLAYHFGGAYRMNSRWLVSAEGEYQQTGLASFHGGGQWRPMEAVSIRVGYKTDTLDGLSALAGLTTGIGLNFWGQEFAYAWAPYGELGNAQYFSLLVRFGAREEERRNLIQYQNIKKHRTVNTKPNKNDLEPEYQQLMQLLSEQDTRTAQSENLDKGQ